jgi:ubiquinone biosynthesis protein
MSTQMTAPDKSTALRRFFGRLPESVRPALIAGVLGGEIDSVKVETILKGVDWSTRRDALEDLLQAVLPVDELVPDVYENWRPVVRDGISFIGARLAPERLIPKLIEQLTLPQETRPEDRLLRFIQRVPSLQKVGQIVARNPNLDPGFRAMLAGLEDDIRDADEAEVFAAVERDLGKILKANGIQFERRVFAEGSVSALVRFRPALRQPHSRQAGVLKVLKPFIIEYFQEELDLLRQLAEHFDATREKYRLDSINLRAILDEVRSLFERETDFVNERNSLAAAARRYADVPGIRIPKPFPQLSTNSITAMTEEPSIKITTAFPGDAEFRASIARRLIECLVARPLFSAEEISPFHADPHAGNLRVDEFTGDLVLLDWALTDSLCRGDRRNLMLLYIALPLRDEGQIIEALHQLCPSPAAEDRELIKRQVEAFMDVLPFGSVPGSNGVSDLMDQLLRSGARFSGAFLIFRKMLSTLGNVVQQFAPGVSIDKVVSEYAVSRTLQNALSKQDAAPEFRLPLQPPDVLRIGFSAQSFLPRLWAQSVRSVVRTLAAKCQDRCSANPAESRMEPQ